MRGERRVATGAEPQGRATRKRTSRPSATANVARKRVSWYRPWGEVRMPRTTELGKIPAVDLAYALNRLIHEGKTSLAEVRRFAGERPARIAALEHELATLKAGHASAKAAGHPAGPRPPDVKRPQRTFTMPAK